MAEAANRGDFDAYMSHFVRDAVWQTRFGTRLEGTTAIRSYFEEFTGSVEGYRVEFLEFVDLGGGVTLWVARQGGRPGRQRFRARPRARATDVKRLVELNTRALCATSDRAREQ
jgi:hypothetical protein